MGLGFDREYSEAKMKNQYTKSVEEHLSDKRENPAKKKRANKPRQDTIDGFESMEKDVELTLFQSDLVTEFEFPDRKPSLTNLIQYFFDEEFLDLYVQENVKLCDSNELPNLLINPNSSSQRRDLLVVRRKFVLRFIATRFLIMSNPNHKLKKNWSLSNQFNDIQERQYLGRNNFQQMISHMLIRLTMTKAVNDRLAKYILSGRHVMLDEKHKGTNKDAHLARWVHGKDPNWGHWITELTTIAPTTGMPLLMKVLPLTSTDADKVTIEPFNNFSLIDVHKEIVPCLRDGTFIVMDAYYLDDESRKYLRLEKVKYLAAINPVRFKEVWEELGVHVQKPGDWVNFYNEDTQEHAMMRYDPLKGDRKQHVITNVFENRKKVSKKDPIINVISDVYLLLFNGCDRLNSYFDNKYWPYHRWGWQSNFDDFFFAAISMNIYVMYHEINQIALEDKISWDDFALMCARATIDYIEGL